jgi:hypothetical protein
MTNAALPSRPPAFSEHDLESLALQGVRVAQAEKIDFASSGFGKGDDLSTAIC